MKRRLCIALLVSLVANSRAGIIVGPWAPLFKGIDHSAGQMIADGVDPQNQAIQVLRIDLTDPDIQLLSTPAATNYIPDVSETLSQSVSSFLEANQVQVAIDGNFYTSSQGSDPTIEGLAMEVYGLQISRGKVVSAAETADSAATLLFTTNNQPLFAFTNNPPGTNTAGIFTAISGRYPLLVNGVNIWTGNDGNSPIGGLQPRTAVGVSQDQRYLFLMTIDGRQSPYSDGALDSQTGEWLLRYGVYNAINMDGGGSTTMVMSDCAGKAIELNKPSYIPARGRERYIGSHFGVYAKPADPFIGSPQVMAGNTTANVTWTTPVPATSQVEYGLTAAYGNSTPLDPTLTSSHTMHLGGLLPGTNYFFRISSRADGTQHMAECFFFTTNIVLKVMDLTNSWRYTTNNLDGVGWKAKAYDDSGWLGSGPGLLYNENNNQVPAKNTQVPLMANNFPAPTYYFRTHFNFSDALAGVSMTFSNYIDDGAVFYLNGTEIQRVRMPVAPAPIVYVTTASASPSGGDATTPDLFTLSSELANVLVVGDNVLAVEVHQILPNSSDIVFGSAITYVPSGVTLNSPPTLTVPGPQRLNELATLTVTNTASDPDIASQQLTFALVSAPTGARVDPISGVFTWTPTEAQGPSTNDIVVRVFDNGSPSLSATQSFSVIVDEVNSAPILVSPGIVPANELVTLRLTNQVTDADLPANTLTFALLAGPAGATLDAASGVLTWTPAEAQGPSTNAVTVRVFDNGVPSLSATQSFTIVVGEVNTPPVLAAIADQALNELATLNLTNSATDSDIPANAVSFALVSGPAGVTVDAVTGVLTWTPSESQGPSTNVIFVRAFDNGSPSLSATQHFTVVVSEVNSPPSLAPIVDRTLNELTTLRVTNVATDVDLPANILTFSIVSGPAGAGVDPLTGILTWTPTEAQGPSTNLIVVRAVDNGSPSLSATQSFTVFVNDVNSAPALSVPVTQTLNELTTLRVTNTATDVDLPANNLTFGLVSGPAGMVLDPATGVLTWTPSEAQGPSTNVVAVRVFDDGTPSLSATQSFTVIVTEVNSAPVLSVPITQTLNELTTLRVTNTATDADLPANNLTFGLVSGPAGVALDPATGVLTWTPTEAQGPSTNVVVVQVFDDGTPSLSATQSFTVIVAEVNSAPVLSVPITQTLNELTTLRVTNTATDADLPANNLTFGLVSGPAGVALDPATGVLTWTPTEAQGPSTNVVVVQVSDDGAPSLSATQSFTVVVNEVNSAPVFAAMVDQTVNELTTLRVTNAASDSDLPANLLTFELISGPAGMALDPVTGIASWTPTEAQGPSTNQVIVRVFDDGTPSLSATQSFNVVVSEVNLSPVLVPVADQFVTEGSLLTFTVTASDADLPANALTFSLDAGAPAGASISAGGIFSWTPPAGFVPATNAVVIRVTDDGVPSLSDATTVRVILVSGPKILSIIQAASGDITLVWTSIAGRTYRVLYKSDLNDSTWQALGNDTVATDSTTTVVDAIGAVAPRFYRILQLN